MREILITSSVLIAVLLLLRVIFAKKVSRVLIYGAWALVALRLLIPVQIGEIDFSILTSAKPVTEAITQIEQRPVSGQTKEEVYQDIVADYIEKDQTVFIPEVQEQIKQEISQGTVSREEILDKIQQARPNQDIFVPEVQQQVQQQVEETADPITLGQIANIVWLAGVAVMAVWFMVVNLRHSRMLLKNREKLECDSPIPVYVSEKVGSPCLAGLFRPAIYLTPECTASEETRRHVLTHELTHYAHKDHIWSVVRCICLCVYWFDPLVWVAAWFSRRDCELACDEGALKRLGEDQRIAYGRSLLDVVSHASTPANLMQTATAMNETKKQLKERVNFIVKKPKISLIAAICMVLVCAIVAGCAAAGPANMATNSSNPSIPQPKDPTKWVYLVTGRKSNSYVNLVSYDQEFLYDENWQLTGWVTKQENKDPSERTIEVDAEARTMKVYIDTDLTESYEYDASGNLINDVYYFRGKIANERKYSYTEDGKLLQILDYRYDDNGEAHEIVEELRTYDLYGRLDTKSIYSYLRELSSEEEKEGRRNYHYRYHYDENGRLSRMDTYEDHYDSGTDIDEYTLYDYNEQDRSVTENTYATRGNSSSGYTQVLDSVRIVRYDEAGKVIYTEKYDMFAPDLKDIMTYTYQAVQVPLDAFTPSYVTLPEEHPNFLIGNSPEISQEDRNQYIQAVGALEQYSHGHDITYTDEYGTYNGQDALWAICRLLVRLEGHGDCAELLGKFRAVDVVNKSITIFNVPLSDIERVTTKNQSFKYNNQGQLVSMWCEGIFEDLELTEDTFVRCEYGDGKLVGFTAYDEEGGNLVARVQFHYDDQGRRTGGQLGLGTDQTFPISYSYDAAGRLSGWYYLNLQGCRTEMTCTYDEQGRLQQTVQNQFLSNGQGLQALSRKVTRDYRYDVAGVLAMIVETECQYREGRLITQQEDRIFLEYDSKGRLQEFQRMIQATKDQNGNILGDAKTKWETTLYFYESWLVYEP